MAIIMIRTLIIYLALLVSMRMMGKRQLGELEVSELVVAVIVADVAAIPLQDIGIPLINGLIPLILLFSFEILVTGAVTKNIRFRLLLCGKPSTLIENGKIDQQEMHKNRFTLDELYEELRQQGTTDISTIERAILETSGNLNVVLYPTQQPPTCAQMGIEVPPVCYPVIIINEGRILSENLRQMGRDAHWLDKELHARGLTPQQVYLMTIDRLGKTYLAPMEEPS